MTTLAFIRWTVAALHLLGLGLGLGAIWARHRALYADAFWGIAALIWISTGLARAFAGLEKGTAFYLASNAFWLKMGLLALVLILEIWPMITLIRWRIQLSRGETIDTQNAGGFARISAIQAVLVVAMVFAARPWPGGWAPEPTPAQVV